MLSLSMPLGRYLKDNLLTPPYRLLPLAVFAYVAACFLLHPLSPLRIGAFTDPDDYMRLNEVIAWLQGQGWHDLSVPRMSPGAGTIIHWSRLVDVPIALCMLPFIKLMGIQNAALAASFIVPMAILGLLLALVPALARPFTGEKSANIASIMLLFAPMTLFNFTPGRVDHHGWQVLIAGFGLYCLERMIGEKTGWRFAIAAAVAFACGLWIGTEALPWLIIFILCLAIIAVWQGGFALRNAAVFGVALTAATALVLPLALAHEEFSSRALSWFSPADVIFAALAGGTLLCGWLVGMRSMDRRVRLTVMALFGIAAGVAFFALIPGALHGVYNDYDDFDSTIALANINEAQPLAHALHFMLNRPFTYATALTNFMYGVFLPLIALCGIALSLEGAGARERMIRLAHGAFLLAALLLTLFWQVRVSWFLQLFTIAPLTGLLCDGWWKIGRELKGRTKLWAEIGLFCILGPLPIVLLPAALHNEKFASDVLLFPASRGEKSCPLRHTAEFLAEPWGLGSKPHVILSGGNEGPELLFRTQHSVVAGNFNVPGNRDVFDFFNAHDDRTAKAILDKWKADLVLTCRHVSPFYKGLGENKVFVVAGKDGKLHLTGNPQHPALVEKLVNGTPPGWLKPVEIPGESDYLLFTVRH